VKSRELVLSGTTADRMKSAYTRIHRMSINEPATIHDFPFEVIENCLKYLSPQDLVSPSLACRAWRPAAIGLIVSLFNLFGRGLKSTGRIVCGLQLRHLVFGEGSCNIKSGLILLIARQVAPTLSSLMIGFRGSSNHYQILDIFLSQCLKIKSLQLRGFDSEKDPSMISSSIKEVFGRLNQLDIMWCRGDVSMFLNHTPITKLQSLKFSSLRVAAGESDIISSIVMNCRSLKSVDVNAKFDSSECLLNIAECCRRLEALIITNSYGVLVLRRSDIESIASLPYLKELVIIGAGLTEEVVSPLNRCKKLKHLSLVIDFSLLRPVLAVIGRELSGLDLRVINCDSVKGIVEYCPNLERLHFLDVVKCEDRSAALETLIKNGLKRLKVLRVNCVNVRLGSEWAGY
jgi:hypothetical protein